MVYNIYELSGRYSKLHWDSIVENIEKMIGCGDSSNGYAEYVCPQCSNKKKVPLKVFKMVSHYGIYTRRSKSISMKILQSFKRFIQMTIEFITNGSKSLTWRERMINSFGRNPLICSKCKEEMLLWRIWHPKYGEIFDLSRDGPFEENMKDKENQTIQDQQNEHIQLAQFPI